VNERRQPTEGEWVEQLWSECGKKTFCARVYSVTPTVSPWALHKCTGGPYCDGKCVPKEAAE